MTKDTLEFTQLMGAESNASPTSDQPIPGGLDNNPSPAGVPNLPVETDDDEEALEQYMSSMLERLTGGKPPTPAVTEPLPNEPVEATVEATPVVAKAPRETVRPSELQEDLSGMRELANRNVESALGVHAYSGLVKSTKSTLAAALGISLISSLLVLYNHSTGAPWAYPAALAGTAVAALASLRYFGLARKLAKIDRQLRMASE